jgi:hypothetical protein
MAWRYGPALAAAVPAGVAAEPVLEVADGLRGRARIVVAVGEADKPARLEIWEFSQRNPRDRLERVDAPVVLLDLDPAAAAVSDDALAELRREMASPSSESGRSVGLAVVGEPTALLAELARLAAEATTPGAAGARALAQFTRGLDDRLLWSGRLAELLRRLAGGWQVGEVTPVGARRVRVAVQEGERALRLELARTQDRWVLTDVMP